MRPKSANHNPAIRNSEAEIKGALGVDVPRKPQTKLELSEFIGVTPRFLETEVNAGRLRCVKLGTRAVRFLPTDIARWMNARASIDETA